MKRANNRTIMVLCLAASAVLVAACDNAMNLGRAVTELKSDVSGEYSFEVEVRYGELLPESEARWVLENMKIVPYQEAFPGMEKPPIESLFYDGSEMDGDGIRVTLRPLDAEVSPGDFAWLVPLRAEKDRDEQDTGLPEGLSQKESALIYIGLTLSPYEEVRDIQYQCLVYNVTGVFNPDPRDCDFLICPSINGRFCVDQGKYGKAGTTCKKSNHAAMNIFKSSWTRAYWRTRVKAGASRGVVGAYGVYCL